MIQIAPQMRLLVAVEAADFRRDIDCLVRVCREALGADPFSGAAPDSGIAERRITITAIMAFAEAPLAAAARGLPFGGRWLPCGPWV